MYPAARAPGDSYTIFIRCRPDGVAESFERHFLVFRNRRVILPWLASVGVLVDVAPSLERATTF